MKFYTTGVSNFMYGERSTFLKLKNGYILPINLLIKPMYDPINNDFHYISYLQKSNTDYDFIIINDDGTIIALTQKITEYFGWLPIDFD